MSKLVGEFEEIEFTHLGREGNQFVDALVTLASMARIDLKDKTFSRYTLISEDKPAHCCSFEGEIDGNPWY